MRQKRKKRAPQASKRKPSNSSKHAPKKSVRAAGQRADGGLAPRGAGSRNAAPAAHTVWPRLGAEGIVDMVVPHNWTIQAHSPKLPAVLSTPAMIGMMEFAAFRAIEPQLPPGVITVGTRIEVDHLKAVSDGAQVRAWARLVKREGRFLVFEVEARSGEHVIGRGRVFRAVVEPEKHGARAQARTKTVTGD